VIIPVSQGSNGISRVKDSRTRLDVALENGSQLFCQLHLMAHSGGTYPCIHCGPLSTSFVVNSEGLTEDLVRLSKPKTEFVHSHELFIRLCAFFPHFRSISSQASKAKTELQSRRSRQTLNAIPYSYATRKISAMSRRFFVGGA
jgi:hypothetical protein